MYREHTYALNKHQTNYKIFGFQSLDALIKISPYPRTTMPQLHALREFWVLFNQIGSKVYKLS